MNPNNWYNGLKREKRHVQYFEERNVVTFNI